MDLAIRQIAQDDVERFREVLDAVARESDFFHFWKRHPSNKFERLFSRT